MDGVGLNGLNSTVMNEFPDRTLQLPDEIMQFVLGYLDSQSLSNAVVVCWRWNRLGIESRKKHENSTVTSIIQLLKNGLPEDIFRDLRNSLSGVVGLNDLSLRDLQKIRVQASMREYIICGLLSDAKAVLGEKRLDSLLGAVCKEYSRKDFTTRALKISATIRESETKCDVRLAIFERLHALGDDVQAMEVLNGAVYEVYNKVFVAAKASFILLKIANLLRENNFIDRAIEVADLISKARGRSLFYKKVAISFISQDQIDRAVQLVKGKCGQRDRSKVYQIACLEWCKIGAVSKAIEFSDNIPSWRVRKLTLKSIQALHT